jgi:elongation factor Ts
MEAESDQFLVDYIHGEGSIGVMVKVKLSDPKLLDDERVRAFAFDLALHVAAYSPLYLSKESVDKAYLEEQEGVFRKQAESLDKPEKVLAGIVKGKLNKHLSEICLLDQGFVKEEKKSVAQAASDFGKEVACDIAVVDFNYYKVGEEV